MKRTLLVTVFAGAILLSLQVTHAQTPIYREVFGNNTAVNLNVTGVGWVGDYGVNGYSPSVLGGAYTNNFGISSALGDPQNLDNINAGGAALSTANGLLFTSGGTMATANWIAYTTGYTVDTSVNSIQDISFYAGSAVNGSVIPGFRVAVQIDGNWYATSQVFANTVSVGSAANFNSLAQQETFTWTTAASAWDSLSFTAGTSLVLGSTLVSDLPSDSITAFGLYSDAITGGSTRRADTFEIDASPVPEPGSVMLAMSGLGVLMGLRRFRKA
jgi:hypothetical protein